MTTYFVEEGRFDYAIEARVLLFTESGSEIGDLRTRTSEGGRFERGSYAGDYRELDLSRSEQMLFDPARADGVLRRVVDKIP